MDILWAAHGARHWGVQKGGPGPRPGAPALKVAGVLLAQDAGQIPCAKGCNGRGSVQQAVGCFPHSLPWARRGSSQSPPRDAVEMSQQRHLHVRGTRETLPHPRVLTSKPSLLSRGWGLGQQAS